MCFERNKIFYTLWGQICSQEREEAKQHKLLEILARSLGARRQTSEFNHIGVPSLCLHCQQAQLRGRPVQQNSTPTVNCSKLTVLRTELVKRMQRVYRAVLFLLFSLLYGMAIWVVEFSKLERCLPKNQHTQRKLLKFENWPLMGKCQKLGIILESKVIQKLCS